MSQDSYSVSDALLKPFSPDRVSPPPLSSSLQACPTLPVAAESDKGLSENKRYFIPREPAETHGTVFLPVSGGRMASETDECWEALGQSLGPSTGRPKHSSPEHISSDYQGLRLNQHLAHHTDITL